jgi:hypothetical protein
MVVAPLVRRVECRRDAASSHAADPYELWLQCALDATRARGEKLVFVDAWNDWLHAKYRVPDDRDGRAALLATRRAARGPASGMVLLQRLRGALGAVGAAADSTLAELEAVLAVHERARDRLLASVEVALGRTPVRDECLRFVPISSRSLPASGSPAFLDRLGDVGVHGASSPIRVSGEHVRVMGWAQLGEHSPEAVELFIALESAAGMDDRVFRVGARTERPDVTAAFPGFPPNCGFDTSISLAGVAPGVYDVALVQSTPNGTYRDATSITIEREGTSCSSA